MKKLLFIFLLIFVGCHKSKVAFDTFERKTYDPKSVLEASELNVVVDASLITVQLTVDQTVPVKGTLNIKDGKLTFRNVTELFLTLDPASWDSGLTERDLLTRKIFFGEDPIKMNFAGDATLWGKLQSQKALQGLHTWSTLTWGSKNLTFPAKMDVGLTPQGYLFAKTVEPIQLKISDLGRSELLTKLIEAGRKVEIGDSILVDVYLEFEPAPLTKS